MKNEILLELARRWEAEAEVPVVEENHDDNGVSHAKAQGYRECKRECADTIKTLISIFKENVS